jgi:hypothetical protein
MGTGPRSEGGGGQSPLARLGRRRLPSLHPNVGVERACCGSPRMQGATTKTKVMAMMTMTTMMMMRGAQSCGCEAQREK